MSNKYEPTFVEVIDNARINYKPLEERQVLALEGILAELKKLSGCINAGRVRVSTGGL